MKLIHVKDIGTNFCPMYSVEWVEKKWDYIGSGAPQAWNQHGLTPHKKVARLLYFELWLRGRGRTHRRVRVF